MKRAIGILPFPLGALLMAGCPGELEIPPGCCPKMKALAVQDPWICPANCPGGGKTRVNYEIEFWQKEERCKPPKGFRISIKNLTDNVDLPPLTWTNPSVGVYKGTSDVTLTKDTEFELTATGDEVCAKVSGKVKVQVVDKGDFLKMCFSGPLDWPHCEHKGYQPFGPGVLVERVHNPSSLGVRVTKDKTSEFLAPYGDGYAHSNSPASGTWSVGLTSKQDCNIYANLPKDQQQLCADVYLQCKCP